MKVHQVYQLMTAVVFNQDKDLYNMFYIAPVAQVKEFQELCLILNPGLKDRVLHVSCRVSVMEMGHFSLGTYI